MKRFIIWKEDRPSFQLSRDIWCCRETVLTGTIFFLQLLLARAPNRGPTRLRVVPLDHVAPRTYWLNICQSQRPFCMPYSVKVHTRYLVDICRTTWSFSHSGSYYLCVKEHFNIIIDWPKRLRRLCWIEIYDNDYKVYESRENRWKIDDDSSYVHENWSTCAATLNRVFVCKSFQTLKTIQQCESQSVFFIQRSRTFNNKMKHLREGFCNKSEKGKILKSSCRNLIDFDDAGIS